jgi:hypothetical protein
MRSINSQSKILMLLMTGLLFIGCAHDPVSRSTPEMPAPTPGKEHPEQETSQPASDLSERAQSLLQEIQNADYSGATEKFDTTMKQVLPAAKLQESWQRLIEAYGPLQSVTVIEQVKVENYDQVILALKFLQDKLEAKVAFNSNKEVSGLFFVPARPQGEP